MRNPYKKFQDSSMHMSKVMLCIKKRDEQKEEWTNAPEAICPSNFFEVGGIKKAKLFANSGDPNQIFFNTAFFDPSSSLSDVISETLL